MSPDAEVSDTDIRRFLEAIHATYGYDLRDYQPRSMRRRVLVALARSALPSLADLEDAAVRDPEVFTRVIGDLTVRVSELFRDPPFYRAFRAAVVPLLRTYPMLGIWHAGCAAGEEVYSTAVVLDEEGLYDRAQVYATDLSPRAIDDARQGIYPAEAAAKLASNHAASGGVRAIDEYVTPAYSHFAFRERLKKNLVFFQHDLVNDHSFGEMHVVFCRNVLMYFGPTLRRRVLEKLALSVRPGGFLCLGSAERIGPEDRGAFVEFASNVNIYRKQA